VAILQLVKKFSALLWNRSCIFIFTRTCQWFLSWGS